MLVQLVHNGEPTFTRQVMRISDDQEKVNGYIQICPLKVSVRLLRSFTGAEQWIYYNFFVVLNI